MRGRSLIASLTCIAFTALVVWPRGASAADKPAPADKSGGSTAPGKPATPPGDSTAAPPAGAPPPNAASPPSDDATLAQAKQHFEAGRNAYNAGDYPGAIREFKAAEQLRPSPILAYNIGLANEKLGKKRVAAKYYRRYLEQQPNAPNRAEVEQRIAALDAEIAAQPPPAATATPGGTAPQPPPPNAEQPADNPPENAAPPPSGYDPYKSQPPPGQPVTQAPKKKRSLWWIGLVVGGAVTITVVIVVIAVLASSSSSTYYADHAPALQPMPAPRLERHDLSAPVLFRF